MKNNILKIYMIMMFVVLINPLQVNAITNNSTDFVLDSLYGQPRFNLDKDKENDKNKFDDNVEVGEANEYRGDVTGPDNITPPVKLIRLKLKAYLNKRQQDKEAKKNAYTLNEDELTSDTDEINNDPYLTEKDKHARAKRDKLKQFKKDIQLMIECKHMDYNPDNGAMVATGDVVVTSPENDTKLMADIMTLNRATGKIHAEGNVVIEQSGQKTFGELMDVDLNEENIFLTKPITENVDFKIVSESGNINRNIITLNDGKIDIERSIPFILRGMSGPDINIYKSLMRLQDKDKVNFTDGKSKIFQIQANEIYINSRSNYDVLKLKKAKITTSGRTVCKVPSMTIYTNKGHDYFEGNYPELGSRRMLGSYIGPGIVMELPKGSLLKLMPILTYGNSKIGFGGLARFWSGTNMTEVGYATSRCKVMVRGEQKLDDHLKIHYAMYEYMDDWFLGRRMPKLGAELLYRNVYYDDHLLGKRLRTRFEHRIGAGYYHDLGNGEDSYYPELHGNGIGTTRFRYMAELSQPIYRYDIPEKEFYSTLSVFFQGSAALYGTGDSQMVGSMGPSLNTQYKKWLQQIGYNITTFHDSSPLRVYDAYRYGQSSVYLREYLRVCKYFTIAWQGSVALSGRTYNSELFQECAFFAMLGPDDAKVNIGYDFARKYAFINYLLAINPKGTTVDYKTLVIKDPDNFNKLKKQNEILYKAANEVPKGTKSKEVTEDFGLTHAIVDDIEDNHDDI